MWACQQEDLDVWTTRSRAVVEKYAGHIIVPSGIAQWLACERLEAEHGAVHSPPAHFHAGAACGSFSGFGGGQQCWHTTGRFAGMKSSLPRWRTKSCCQGWGLLSFNFMLKC